VHEFLGMLRLGETIDVEPFAFVDDRVTARQSDKSLQKAWMTWYPPPFALALAGTRSPPTPRPHSMACAKRTEPTSPCTAPDMGFKIRPSVLSALS
jgi:hypothetical protein